MIVTIAAAALAAHLGAAPAGDTDNLVHQVRGGWCSHGYDIDIHGRCYPNGVIPPQYQAARQYGAYGRYGGDTGTPIHGTITIGAGITESVEAQARSPPQSGPPAAAAGPLTQ